MRSWSRSYLYETIYHVLAVVGRACGGGVGEVVKASFRGDGYPEHVRLQMRYGDSSADVSLDYTAAVEEDSLARRSIDAPQDERIWRRQGREITLTDAAGVHAVERRGNDVQLMLENFRDVVLEKAEPGASLEEALDVMRTARRVVDAVDAAGAPFERPTAPKHVASRALQQPFQ
jgi:hypothetical protein